MKFLFALLAASLGLTAQVVISRNPQNRTGKSSIEGKVVDALTHEPIRKAVVTLNGAGVGLSVATDAEGHFAFRQLPDGRYMLQAQSAGYPIDRVATGQNAIALRADEEKRDLELALIPGGSLGGRVVDEEGNPMPQCQLTTMIYDKNTGQTVPAQGGSQSDEKGEYRIENLPAGKYYVMARCFQAIPLPHAFLSREEARHAPALVYPARFYPAAELPAGAAHVTVTPGANVAGIDLQMAPASGVAVRGRVLGKVTRRQLIVQLQPRDSPFAGFRLEQGAANPNTGEFSIANVPRGSYELSVMGAGDDCDCYARVPIEVGDAAPEPVDIAVLPKPLLSGTVSVDGDSKAPLTNLHVTLMPRPGSWDGRQPQAQVAADGSFTLTAPPAHWRLQVNGAPGYIKSVTLGDQSVSPANLATGTEPGSLKIVIGTKYAQIDVAVTSLSDAGMTAGILWSAGDDAETRQGFIINAQGHAGLNVPPGLYYACAFDTLNQGPVFQDLALLKALESRCTKVEAGEGEHPSVAVPVISADDVKRLQESLDSSDSAAPR